MNIWLDLNSQLYQLIKLYIHDLGLDYNEIECPFRNGVRQLIVSHTDFPDQLALEAELSDLGPFNG